MCTKKCTIIGAVMVLVAAVSLAAEPVATFDLDGNNGVNVSYVGFCDYEGARQIGIAWPGEERNYSWLISISDLSPLVFGVWVDSTEVTDGAYASLPSPYNTYFLLGVAAYTGSVDPAFELRLYWDQDGEGDKDTGDTLEDTAIMYTF